MSSDLRNKLEAELLQGQWQDIKAHAERHAVFLISQDLILVDVAMAMANDEVERVNIWVQGGLCSEPTRDQLLKWEQTPLKEFRFLIVQPFVLIQDLAN